MFVTKRQKNFSSLSDVAVAGAGTSMTDDRGAERGVWRGAARLAAAAFALAATATSNARAAPLEDAAMAFKPYVAGQIAESLSHVRELRERIALNDLAGAQQAWLAARAGWEASETVSREFFPDLDAAIDAWPNSKMGFHAIEAKLFGAHRLDALPETDELVANLAAFDAQLRAAMLTRQGLLSGVTKLAFEIGENKADGGESQFSGNSLAEIGYNLAAIKATYRSVFAPALDERNAARGQEIDKAIDELQALVAVPLLADLDQARLRALSEGLANALQAAAPELGLAKPSLAD
jgi:iron uptake system EfeUOB component EfeO/EfeM